MHTCPPVIHLACIAGQATAWRDSDSASCAGLQVAPKVDPLLPKACSTDFASTVGKRPAFQAAFYFGTGLVSLDASSAEAPFGLGPLAAGAQRFTAVAACHELLPAGRESGRRALEAAGAPCDTTESGEAVRMTALASPMSDGVGSLLCDEQLQSPEAMELCGDAAASRGSAEQQRRLFGHRRPCASPDEEPRSPRGHQHQLLGLSPLLGRSLQKLRRSWGSGAATAGAATAKEACLASEAACSGGLDMQPLWRGHTENVRPNAAGSPGTPPETGAARAAGAGAPQRSPLRERRCNEGGNGAAAAPQGPPRAAGPGRQHHASSQQQHRLSRAGRQERLEWRAASTTPQEGGAAAGAAAAGSSGAGHTRLSRLRAVMTMSTLDATLDASLDGAMLMGSPGPMVRTPLARRLALGVLLALEQTQPFGQAGDTVTTQLHLHNARFQGWPGLQLLVMPV